MKSITILAFLVSIQFCAAEGYFSPVQNAIELVSKNYCKDNPPNKPFTLACMDADDGDWKPMGKQLKNKLLKSLGTSAKHFISFSKATYDNKTSAFKDSSGRLIEVYHVISITYISSNKLKIGFGSYSGPLGGHGVFYEVTHDGKKLHVTSVSTFDS